MENRAYEAFVKEAMYTWFDNQQELRYYKHRLKVVTRLRRLKLEKVIWNLK